MSRQRLAMVLFAVMAAMILQPFAAPVLQRWRQDDGREDSVQPDPPAPVDDAISPTDSGSETARKFMAMYAAKHAVLAQEIAERVQTTEEDSFQVASAWAAASKAARESASAGVDARAAALAADESMTREQKAEWLRDAGRGFADVARRLRK